MGALGAVPTIVIVKLLVDEHENMMEGAAFAIGSLCDNCADNRDIVLKEDGLRLLEMVVSADVSVAVRETAKEAIRIFSVASTASSSSKANIIILLSY